MKFQSLFFNGHQRLRTIWRILIFISALSISVLPLVLINNSLIQFFGVAVILVIGLKISSKYLDKLDFSEYGLVLKGETFIYFSVGLTIGFLSVLSMFSLGRLTGFLISSEPVAHLDYQLVILFGFKMILVGFLEESFFRGYLFTNIYIDFKSNKEKRRQGFILALLISSLLFGLAHLGTSNANIFSILFLTLNGIVWCIPFVITKNLGLSIGLHAAWNFFQTQIGFTMSGNKASNSLYLIENNGPDWFTGGEYGPEAGILGLIGFILMLLLSLAYLKLFKKQQKLL